MELPHPLVHSTDIRAPLFSITVPVAMFFEDSMTAHLWRMRGDFLCHIVALPSLPGLGVAYIESKYFSRGPSALGNIEYFQCP